MMTRKSNRTTRLAILVGVAAFLGSAGVADGLTPIMIGDKSGESVAPSGEPFDGWAFCVGVVRNETPKSAPYCENDANKMRRALCEVGFDKKRALALTGDEADGETINYKVDCVLASTGPESTVVVSLSGAGFETNDGELWFCPSDFNLDDWEATAISISKLQAKLRADDARYKLLIVDANRPLAEIEGKRRQNRVPSKVAPNENERAFALAFACGKNAEKVYALDDLQNGGAFVGFIVETLRETDDGRGVRFSRLWNQASRRTRKATDGEQVPACFYEGVDFCIGK